MEQVAVKIGAGGRFVIPSELRTALGVQVGDTLILVVDTDGVLLMTPEQAARRAQSLVREYVPAGRMLSEELMAERREEDDGA